MPEVIVEIQFVEGWLELPVWSITHYGEGDTLVWVENLYWRRYPEAASIEARYTNA